MRVVGAGLGRTGTLSLQIALEQLLDGRCYHMGETFGRPDDIPVWQRRDTATQPDWTVFLADYVATVDWPASTFWRELADANPDASCCSRADADVWWKSASSTIFQILTGDRRAGRDPGVGASRMAMTCSPTLHATGQDETAAKAAYEEHNAASAPRSRSAARRLAAGRRLGADLRGLAFPVPDDPFPHVNTTAEFRAMIGLDELRGGSRSGTTGRRRRSRRRSDTVGLAPARDQGGGPGSQVRRRRASPGPSAFSVRAHHMRRPRVASTFTTQLALR